MIIVPLQTPDTLDSILKTGHYTNKYDVEHLLYELSLLECKEKDPHIRILGQPTHALYLLRIVSSHTTYYSFILFK